MSDRQNDQIRDALEIIDHYGGNDGAHHKQWVLDQVVRELTGSDEAYKRWVKKREDEGYEWDVGIPP